ncbi:MAG: MFS transporter, partial [Verrucomicrobia bacterium]|nr:MFS transporter [Verrucomicrobiota bacterium]
MTPTQPLPTTERPSRARFVILGLLFVTVVINYLDRSNLSIAATKFSEDLGINEKRMGFILSAFGWTYALMQIPGGWLVDRIRPRVLYPAAIALWSLATYGLGFAGSFVALIVLRHRKLWGLYLGQFFMSSTLWFFLTWFP